MSELCLRAPPLPSNVKLDCLGVGEFAPSIASCRLHAASGPAPTPPPSTTTISKLSRINRGMLLFLP